MADRADELRQSVLTIEHERLMAFISLRWRSGVIERSKAALGDLLTALTVGHRRAGVSLEEVFRRRALAPVDRRVILHAQKALDEASRELNQHLVGTPGWWRDADTLVRRIADGLMLAVEMVPPSEIEDEFSFEEQPTAVFERPDFAPRL